MSLVERALTAKLLSELAFEGALAVAPLGEGRYAVDIGTARYEFTGRPVAWESWRIAPSVLRAGEEADPFRLLLDLHDAWKLDPAVTALTVAELSTTLAADEHLLATGLPSAQLADLPHHELEGHMGGHPWLVTNKGRVGFGAGDVARYAPESRTPVRLPWMAVHRSLATYRAVAGLERETLGEDELDASTRARFAALADPEEFVHLPVHPWQWDHVVRPWFARYVADGRIRLLGEAPGEYLPQQSIRTFTSLTPGRRDVKLPLSILNTMVYRGIPSELVAAAPVTTAWLHGLRDADPFLAGLVLPGEVAAVSVVHPEFDALAAAPYRYHQLLGVIWREPLASALEAGERARTMASLLHVDPSGRTLVAELISRSGLSARAWTTRLLDVVLPPLLHLMWRHGVVLNPHGENTTVIYDDRDVPVRLAVKDFVDDLKLLADDPLPPGLSADAHAVLLRCSANELVESLVKSLFLGHFRYLAPLLQEQAGLPETEFWRLVRAVIVAYQDRFPQLAARFAAMDLLAPTLPRVVLNRERLLPGGYHDRAERDAHFDLAAPPLANPLHD